MATETLEARLLRLAAECAETHGHWPIREMPCPFIAACEGETITALCRVVAAGRETYDAHKPFEEDGPDGTPCECPLCAAYAALDAVDGEEE